MTKAILSLILLAVAADASAAELLCQVKVNAEIQSVARIEVSENASALYAETHGFRLRVNSRGASRYELEIYDSAVPSRSYSEGALRNGTDELKWALWTREILLETSCRIIVRT